MVNVTEKTKFDPITTERISDFRLDDIRLYSRQIRSFYIIRGKKVYEFSQLEIYNFSATCSRESNSSLTSDSRDCADSRRFLLLSQVRTSCSRMLFSFSLGTLLNRVFFFFFVRLPFEAVAFIRVNVPCESRNLSEALQHFFSCNLVMSCI